MNALAPLSQDRWSPALAAHLLNRAGFGSSPAEIEALYDKGLDPAVEQLVGNRP